MPVDIIVAVAVNSQRKSSHAFLGRFLISMPAARFER